MRRAHNSHRQKNWQQHVKNLTRTITAYHQKTSGRIERGKNNW